MANRLAHFYVRCPPVSAWVKWLMVEHSDQFTPIEGPMQKLRTNWPAQWAYIRGLLIGFMESHQSRLHAQPAPDQPQAGYCWPSPRTWWMAGRAMATVRCLEMSEDLEQFFVEACVGLGPAQEWISWRANADLPNPKDALVNGWPIDRTRLDRVMAVYSSITTYVTNIPDNKEKYQMATLAWNRLQDLINAGMSDMAMTHAQILSVQGCGYDTRGAPPALKNASQPIIKALSDSKKGLTDYIDE